MQTDQDWAFVDAVVRTEPDPVIRFLSGDLVYEEHLIHGCYRSRYWSASMAIKPDAFLRPTGSEPELPFLDEPVAGAFRLSIDGQELWDNWQWISTDRERQSKTGTLEIVVELRHGYCPISVRLHTRLDGTPFIARWLEITNRGDRPVRVGQLAPFAGFLFAGHRLTENLPSGVASPFSFGRFASLSWGRECDFRWMALPDGKYSFGNSGYGPPFFVIRNEITHEIFLGHFAWSGPFEIEVFSDHEPAGDDAWLYASVSLTGPGPLRVIDPGETVVSPAVHLGHLHSDLDRCVQAGHEHLRRSVLPQLPRGRIRPVEMNSWGYVAQEISEQSLINSIDVAAGVGAELFTIDAGWFGDRETDWWPKVGDWITGNRLPRGLEPIFDYARQKGLLCGLWVDLERIGQASELRKEHPDWVARRHGLPAASHLPGSDQIGSNLDLTQPQVVAHAEAVLAQIIEKYQLDVFRLDYNTNMGRAGAQNDRDGSIENSYWRYYENVYAMYERIRKRFPRLLMENCAGGGGRNDIGMLANFHWAHMTDEYGAARSLKILNGFTMALPPEYGLGYIGFLTPENFRYGDLDFKLRVRLFGHFGIGGLSPSLSELQPQALERIRHTIDIYKAFVRPIITSCRVYHHTPVLPNDEAGTWGVLEYVSADRSKAYAGVFRLAGSRDREYLLRPRGLDLSAQYCVSLDNHRETVKVSGLDLYRSGLPVIVAQPMTSELILFERCQA